MNIKTGKKMKKIVLSVAALSMLLVSCTKENISGSSENLVEINVSTGFDDTKAQFGEISDGTYPVLWSEGDKIQLALASVDAENKATRSVFVDASEAAVISNGGKNATFRAELASIEGALIISISLMLRQECRASGDAGR